MKQILAILAGLLMIIIATPPNEATQPECEGIDGDDVCSPVVGDGGGEVMSSSEVCVGSTSVQWVCAHGTMRYLGDAPVSYICPNGIGQQAQTMQACWEVSQFGRGGGLSTGTVTTKSSKSALGQQSCFYTAGGCTNARTYGNYALATTVSTDCHTVTSTNEMFPLLIIPASHGSCDSR